MAEQLPNINVSHRSSSQFTISNITWSGPQNKEEHLIRVNRRIEDVMLVRFSAKTPSSFTWYLIFRKIIKIILHHSAISKIIVEDINI